MVLPAPLGPMTPTMPPGGSRKRQVSISSRSPNPLVSFSASTTRSPSRGPGRDGDLQLVGALLGCLGLGDQLVVGGDAGLALGLAGPRRHAGSTRARVPALRAGRVSAFSSACQARLLLLEPGGVVALPRDAAAPVELEDPAGHVVEEVAVVGDGDDRARVLLQGALQPRHRLGVEVVGRLVEQQQVGLGQQQPAQRHAAPLAAGELGDVGVGRRAAAARPWRSRRSVRDPRRRRRRSCPAGRPARSSSASKSASGSANAAQTSLKRSTQRLGLGDAVRDVAEHVLVRIELRLLGQVPDGEAGREAGLAGEAVVHPGHDPQQ